MHILLMLSIIMASQDSGNVAVSKNQDTVQVFHPTRQVPGKQEILPFDSKGNILEMTTEDAKKLGIFNDINGFLKAYIYKTSPTEYTIAIHHK